MDFLIRKELLLPLQTFEIHLNVFNFLKREKKKMKKKKIFFLQIWLVYVVVTL